MNKLGWPGLSRLEAVRLNGTDVQYINALELELSLALAAHSEDGTWERRAKWMMETAEGFHASKGFLSGHQATWEIVDAESMNKNSQ